ncbi:MAG: hypothetical protein U9Q99_03345 [Nanoarchaeota archaeon]|nr:hypothetical protein [Nanoarchaeota archaeon]
MKLERRNTNMDKKLLSVFALSMIALLSISSVMAIGPGMQQESCTKHGFYHAYASEIFTEEQIEQFETHRESMENAIESKDFNAWKELHLEMLTQENFDKIIASHEKNKEKRETMEQMRQAWENQDYDYIEELREQMHENMPENAGPKEKGMGYHKMQLDGDQKQFKQDFWKRMRFW